MSESFKNETDILHSDKFKYNNFRRSFLFLVFSQTFLMCTTGDNGVIIILSDDDEDEEHDVSCSEASVVIVEVEDIKKNGNSIVHLYHVLRFKVKDAHQRPPPPPPVFQMLCYRKPLWTKTWSSHSPGALRCCLTPATTVPFILSRE